jgi:class 3 adenylate cyclase
MSQIRRLTAILAADVAGYSRLLGADEEGTHERLKAHLARLVYPKIGEHRGRIVKNTGDGFLADFGSVVDAVRCSVEIQRSIMDCEPDLPEAQRIRFRIGVNLGDVIVEENDLFGDGVNVAARLEALAEPGGICVSRVAPRVRAAWLRSDQATIKDTWSVLGMRGTGSQDFVVENVVVPAVHTCFIGEPASETGPLYNPRLVFVTLFSVAAANSLGIARGSIR